MTYWMHGHVSLHGVLLEAVTNYIRLTLSYYLSANRKSDGRQHMQTPGFDYILNIYEAEH